MGDINKYLSLEGKKEEKTGGKPLLRMLIPFVVISVN